ncbi:filamentous hemagglutinin N-terminal domain-containing protein, partial [Undibacterium sp. SXout7W]|uniref:two-partner secretion domain-containing protein n=1 Tax=Undibacterium sp. SXout7W TaxID=3413049 RepID=UPI003BF4A590
MQGEKPVVGVAANGVPVVQIAPPSASGVSNNRFTNYNVGSDGIILNNSGANTQTQLGGWVTGNPMLGNASARVILNQVNGNTPSNIHGYTEVAGTSANVIVANPNGITCDGCGFINVARATLTTGIPFIGTDGSVNGFQISSGQINIDGKGINTRNIDQLDLLSQSLRVNAALWANQLDVITGNNNVSYLSNKFESQNQGQGSGRVSIDVSQLGGMYANSMRLIGTDRGVGVNSAGNILSLTGTLDVNTAGDVRVTAGNLQSATKLKVISGGDISNAGTIRSEESTTLNATGSMHNSGILISANDTASGIDRNGKSIVPQDVIVSVLGELQNSGQIIATNNVLLDASSALTNKSGQIFADNINLSTVGKIDNTSGTIDSSSSLSLTSQGLTNTSGILRQTATAVSTANNSSGITIHGPSTGINPSQIIINDKGMIASNTSTKIEGYSTSNVDGTIQSKNDLSLNLGGTFNNNNGKLLAGDNLVLKSRGDLTGSNGLISSDKTLAISTDGKLSNAEGTLQSHSVQLAAKSIDNTGGTILQAGAGDQSINLIGSLQNSKGTFSTNADTLTFKLENLDNSNGSIIHGGSGSLAIVTDKMLDNSNGKIATNTALTVNADSLKNDSGTLSTRSSADVQVTNFTNAGGVLIAGDALSVQSKEKLNNAGGTIQSAKKLLVSAGTLENNKSEDGTSGRIVTTGTDIATVFVSGRADNDFGFVGGNGGLNLYAASVNNAHGTIFFNKDVKATTNENWFNTNGVLQANEQLLAVIGGNLLNSQGIVQGGGIDLSAFSIDNSFGQILHTGAGIASINVTDLLNNTNGQIIGNGNSLWIATGSLINSSGVINNTGEGMLKITSASSIDNLGGNIVSNGKLKIDAKGINNGQQGLIQAKDDLSITVQGKLLNDAGKITSGGDLMLTAGDLSNSDKGVIHSSKGVILNINGDLSNTKGTIISDGSVDIKASGSINNAEGEVQSGSTLNITGKNLDNTSGRIVSLGATGMQIKIENGIDNTKGLIASNGSAEISAHSLKNQDGSITTIDNLKITVDKFDNQKGQLTVGGMLDLSLNDILDNRGNTLAAKRGLSIYSNGIDNSANGKLLVEGAGPLTLNILGAVKNDKGFIGSNGSVSIVAKEISNLEGTIYANNSAQLSTAGVVNNSAGILQANTALSIRTNGAILNQQGLIQAGKFDFMAASIANNAGKLVQLGSDPSDIRVTSNIDNMKGSIIANASDFNIESGVLDNRNGSIVHTGTGTLNIVSKDNADNRGGAILSKGSLSLSAKALTNGILDADTSQDAKAGYIQSTVTTTIAVRDALDNGKGSIVTGKALNISADGDINNVNGTMEAGSGIALVAKNLNNENGRIVSLDDANTGFKVSDIFNNKTGVIGSNGSVSIVANVLDNTQGSIVTKKDLEISTDKFLNKDGSIDVGGSLILQMNDVLDNRGNNLQAKNGLKIRAISVDNGVNELGVAGKILVTANTGTLELNTREAINNNQGFIGGNGDVLLTAANISNIGGTVYARQDLNITTAAKLDNSQGTVQADGKLNLQNGTG